jgi:hypothetical protein
MIRLIFLSATYYISGSLPKLNNDISGAVIFNAFYLIISGFDRKSKYLIIILHADNTTPGLL